MSLGIPVNEIHEIMKAGSRFIIKGKARLHHINQNYNWETHCHNMEARSVKWDDKKTQIEKNPNNAIKHKHMDTVPGSLSP